MQRRKLLIITYYWIPSGGAGVQRWVKFTKYLRDFGWEPIIYTPENAEYPSEDYSFEKDIPTDIQIVKTPIWEPYNVYRTLFGKKGQKINAGFISENKKSGWKEKLSVWIRGNFLIPDPRRFWINPSVKFLSNYLKENPVDAIVTTGPPHSMHMIGLGLKKKLPKLKWVADFRDPWTKIYYFKDLSLNIFARRYHRYLEMKVLRNSDQLIVVSNDMKRDLGKFTRIKPVVITNGFDNDDIESVIKPELDVKFTLSYIGTLTPNQNPKMLWMVLCKLCQENKQFAADLSIQLIGKIDFSAINDIRMFGLDGNMIMNDYLPHKQAIEKQQSSQVLLLLLVHDKQTAKGILTGKFFEYLSSGRPILAIGPSDGDVADILRETERGEIADFMDVVAIESIIMNYYKQFKDGCLSVPTNSIDKYSRKELTSQLSELLNKI